MKSKFWIIPTIIMVFLVSLLMTACGETEDVTTTETATATETATSTQTATATQTVTATETERTKYGGTLRIIWFKPPSRGFSWEPISRGPWESYAVMPCLEMLVRETKENAEYLPWLATDWEVAPDGLSADLKLRQGVKFHDGTDFNAEAVKFNYDAIIESKLLSSRLLSVDVVDEYTIRMNFEEFLNTWLTEFCRSTIVSPKSVEDNGEEAASWLAVGTGPFRMVSHDPDVDLWLERNDDWWGPKPYLDKIHNIFIVDTMTQIMAMKNGEADACSSRVGRTMKELEDAGFNTTKVCDGAGFLAPSSINPDSPWANLKLRMAVDYALDVDKLVDSYGYGYWTKSNQAAPPGYIGRIPELETMREYDPDMARQLLAEAGYEGGVETKYYAGVTEDKDMVVSTINYLEEVGIHCELEIIEMGMVQELRWEGWEGLFHTSGGLTANFLYYMNKELGPDSINVQGIWRPPEFTEKLLEALQTREMDPAKVQAAARVIFDECLWVPLELHGTQLAYTDQVHGIDWGAWGYWDEWQAELAWMSE